MNNFKEFLDHERTTCEELLKNFNENQNDIDSCPPNFDGINCWPATPAESIIHLPCPVLGQKNKSISRWCSSNVTEITNNNQSIFQWLSSNNSDCFIIDNADDYFINFSQISLLTKETDLYWNLKIYLIVNTGYTVSIISLLIALLIFILIHRLQDTRVKIHINLFISLAIGKFVWLMQDSFYGYRIFSSLITKDTHSNNDSSATCKTLMVIGSYYKLTTFTWILMESWYFYNFISRAPYKQLTRIKSLILVGWGFPFSLIIPYMIIYSLANDVNFCWVDVDSKANILAVPILIMVLINFGFFILNVRVLFCKLNCNVLHQRQKNFWKWLKSTLMLMPLFGIYDIFFCLDPWIENASIKTYSYIMIRIMCSFQGLIVSILYCFMNNDVKTEVIRAWRNWRTNREIDCNIVKRQLIQERLMNKI